jgi:hypothetical protein
MNAKQIMITYLRTGRSVRASGNIIAKYPEGIVKVKPTHENWDCILVTPAEIEAGKEKPPIQRREKSKAPIEAPKREIKPKPATLPRWKVLVAEVRAAERDSRLFPGITMKLVVELADELEAAQTMFQTDQ